MAFKKATIEVFPELKEVVQKLKTKFSVALEDIDPDRILYLKSDGKSKKPIRLSPVKVSFPEFIPVPFKFVIVVYTNIYNDLDVARQVLHILRELRRIENFDNSKMGDYPLQDFPDIVEKFGTLWEEREDIENPLEEKKKTT